MDFLIIGNGFDIAHGLQTTYQEFMSFCHDYNRNSPISESVTLNDEFASLLKDNIWLRYFENITWGSEKNETWIDFEKEIAGIIGIIENNSLKIRHGKNLFSLKGLVFDLRKTNIEWNFRLFLRECCKTYGKLEKFVFSPNNTANLDSFLEFVYFQLRKFTRAFEIYCLKINKTQIKQPVAMEPEEKAGDVLRTIKEESIYHSLLPKFDFVLSFNYTNTYERLYGDSTTKYCYIHGKAQEHKECTNLILGIDDMLLDGRENNDFRCVRFKKYYQRIIFGTGSEYKDWLDKENDKLSPINYVHIVGHSLDRTDHDVLYEFFSDERLKIIVYYYKSEDFEEKVQKVIQLLSYKGNNGRDELIRRAHGKHWSIKFTYLYDEKEGLFKAPAEIKKLEPLNQ